MVKDATHPSSSPTPVHIVTGFLGAGKTTFLNHWIQTSPDERIMVLENEVGAVNLDSGWIEGSFQPPVELTAGCLCCSLNQELIEMLDMLSKQRADFDRLVIETTGVANPESLAEPFLTMSHLERHFKLQNVLCLVDAGNFSHWLSEAEESRRQVAFADALLINKTDTLEPDQAAETVQLVQRINPQARAYTGVQGAFPVPILRELHSFAGEGAVAQQRQVADDHRSENHGISTFTLTFDRPFDLRGLSQALRQLLTINRHQIYRIKGLLHAHDHPAPVVLQSVYRNFVLTDRPPWPPEEPRQSKVVIIGKELKKEALHKVFARHLMR